MNFKEKSVIGVDIIGDILRGYETTREALDNPKGDITYGYKNMSKAVEKLYNSIVECKKIGILADSDADGQTSAVVLGKYIEDLGQDVTILTHSHKKHGLTDEIVKMVKDANIQLLLIPDAGSNDESYGKIGNIDVIVLDHHIIERDVPSNVIRVNNQDIENENSNKNLTGAGMVYRFIQEMDIVMGVDYSDNNIDLVALGLIGDSADISDDEIRYIVNKGISNIKNGLILELLRNRLERGETVTPRDLSFEVIPYINAVCRVGTLSERYELIDALMGRPEYTKVEIVKRRRKDKSTGKFVLVDIKNTGYTHYIQRLSLVKERQRNVIQNTLKDGIKDVSYKGGVVVAIADETVDSGITGLIASKMTTMYDKPSILLLPKEGGYTGSIRGKESILSSLKNWCNSTNLFEWVQGHDNASGCCIKKENIDKLLKKTNEIIPRDYIEVDLIMSRMTPDIADLIYDNRRYFGGKVAYPKIGIQGKLINKKNVVKRGSNTYVIEEDGVDYIIFNPSMDVVELLTRGFSPTVKVDILGEPSINWFRGKKNRQLIINNIELSTVVDEFDFDF